MHTFHVSFTNILHIIFVLNTFFVSLMGNFPRQALKIQECIANAFCIQIHSSKSNTVIVWTTQNTSSQGMPESAQRFQTKEPWCSTSKQFHHHFHNVACTISISTVFLTVYAFHLYQVLCRFQYTNNWLLISYTPRSMPYLGTTLTRLLSLLHPFFLNHHKTWWISNLNRSFFYPFMITCGYTAADLLHRGWYLVQSELGQQSKTICHKQDR